MCVAIAQRKNAVTLTESELNRGWAVNPDGGGYAFIDTKTGKILIRKFMTREPFIKAYLRDHKAHGKNSPFLVHMRIATHGKVMEDTAHPFRVETEYGDMVFAHNGIIDEVAAYTDDTTSDTMAFRDLFLDELPDGWLDNSAIVELVESYIGWSKLVFLTTSIGFSDQLYIINETSGYWKKDSWFSNHSCTPKVTWHSGVQGSSVGRLPVADYDKWFEEEKWEGPDWSKKAQVRPEDPAMSLVVRESMNDILISTSASVIMDEAVKAGYCEFCLFDPCKCADTCYTCNNRKVICACEAWMSIDDMRGYVGDGYFQECRENELLVAWDRMEGNSMPDWTPTRPGNGEEYVY